MIALPRLPSPLPRSFYDRPTDEVAHALIGCRIFHRDGDALRIGRIVETEAYLGERDLACHSSRGRTSRTEVMFGPPGHAYVYFIYGMHFCLNAVTRPPGCAEAVLIRAIEPLQGCQGSGDGPGKVCRALGVGRRHNGLDLTAPALPVGSAFGEGAGAGLFFCDGPGTSGPIARGPRVGVDYAGAWARRLLRFYEKGSPFVSRAGRTRARR